jgi:hypothetical protein
MPNIPSYNRIHILTLDRNMKTKIFALIILAIIALSIIGYSYACYNGGVHIDCYQPYCDLKFICVTTGDNEVIKDVGKVSAEITCDGYTINAYITNSYPCYEAYINYTIKNKGTCPIHFDSVTIINPNPEALEIATTNHTCTWLSPCETVKGTTTVHTLQPAQQNWHYTFQIKIGVTCQKEYPRTIGLWQNQFSEALCKSGRPQVPASTLLTYLNQISSQSAIFKFTGTQTQKFQQALNILSPSTHSNMEAKLKAQLLALWLNYVAGWTEGYKVDGKTAWQIIQESETALINHLTTKYEYWKNLCDDFNNLG